MVDPMTTPTETIPVPVDVLAKLCLSARTLDDEGYPMCNYCREYSGASEYHKTTCPIPALREQLERVTCEHETIGGQFFACNPAKYVCDKCGKIYQK